ncbi:MAG: tail fiber domain-containing protein [Deltaproteobacteria bacterium]
MKLDFDGAGNFSGSEVRKDSSGTTSTDPVSGTYSVNTDGTFTVTTGGGSPETLNGRLSYDAKTIIISRIDSSTTHVIDIGVKAAPNGFSTNTYRGYYAGGSTTTGTANAFYGYSAGFSNTGGQRNTFIGYAAGYKNTTGQYNTFLGYGSGYANTTGNYNTFFGYTTGYKSTTGSNNLYLGNFAGYENTTGIGNVFIGYNAGRNETGSGKLYIDNSSTATPLIYGDFSANTVTINGTLYATVVTPSSREYKDNIQQLKAEDALKTLQGLQPVTFSYKTSPGENHVGFIAEDVPELVAAKERKGISSMDVVSVLTRVIQEQQRVAEEHESIIQNQQKVNVQQQIILEQQQKSIASLSEKISKLEQLLIMSKEMSKAD